MLQSLRMASTSPEPTRVIGIDPGLNITGYGVVVSRGSDVKLVEGGVIRLPPSHGQNLPAIDARSFLAGRPVHREAGAYL